MEANLSLADVKYNLTTNNYILYRDTHRYTRHRVWSWCKLQLLAELCGWYYQQHRQSLHTATSWNEVVNTPQKSCTYVTLKSSTRELDAVGKISVNNSRYPHNVAVIMSFQLLVHSRKAIPYRRCSTDRGGQEGLPRGQNWMPMKSLQQVVTTIISNLSTFCPVGMPHKPRQFTLLP